MIYKIGSIIEEGKRKEKKIVGSNPLNNIFNKINKLAFPI